MNKVMTVREIAEKLNLRVFSGEAGLDREVTGGYVSDLLGSGEQTFELAGRIYNLLSRG